MPRIFPWFENDRCPAERALAPTPSTGLRASLDGNIAAYAWPIALTALLVFASAACGGAGGGGAQSSGSSAGQASPETDFAPTPGDEAASSAGAAASSAARQVEGGAEEGPRAALPGFDGEKIVKTAELEVRSEDVRGAASRAQEVAARFGGSVTSSRVDGGDDGVTADLVLSVPSPEFEAALEELRGLGEVTTDTVGGEDVTEEFVDLESRERNLLAAEDGLLGLYGEVESVDDALAIERELTDLRGQIETVQGRIQFLEDRATTSRIALGIQPVRGPATPEPALEPVRAVAAAWEASLAFLGTVAGAVISVVVFGWWLLPALVAASVWWRRRTRRASPAEGP